MGEEGGTVLHMVRRLDGIESELRELRGLMAQLVRVEERSNADRAEVGRLGAELTLLRDEVGTLKERSSRAGRSEERRVGKECRL